MSESIDAGIMDLLKASRVSPSGSGALQPLSLQSLLDAEVHVAT